MSVEEAPEEREDPTLNIGNNMDRRAKFIDGFAPCNLNTLASKYELKKFVKALNETNRLP